MAHRSPRAMSGVFLKSRGANLHKFTRINARAIRRIQSSPRLGRFSSRPNRISVVSSAKLDLGRFTNVGALPKSSIGRPLNLRRFNAEGKTPDYRASRPTITRFPADGKQPHPNNSRFRASRYVEVDKKRVYFPSSLKMDRFPTIDKTAPSRPQDNTPSVGRFNPVGTGSENARRILWLNRPSRFSFKGLRIAPKISAKDNRPARYSENAMRQGIRRKYAPKRTIHIPLGTILLTLAMLAILAGIAFLVYTLIIDNDSMLGLN